MKISESLLSFVITLFIIISVNSQNTKKEIDSLRVVALTAQDSLKFDIYNRMAFYYIFNDVNKADSILQSAMKQVSFNDDLYSTVLLTNTTGIRYDVHQVYDSAYYYFDRARTLSRKHNFKYQESRSLNNLGMNAWNQGDLSQAQDYFFEALETSRKYFPEERTDSFLNNIGLIYQELESLDKALEYHNQALAERKKIKAEVAQITSYNNIGICHRILGNSKEALDAYENALRIMNTVDAYQLYQSVNNNKGNLLLDLGKYEEAIEAFKKAEIKPENATYDARSSFMGTGGLAYGYYLTGDIGQAEVKLSQGFEKLEKENSYRSNAETLYKAAALINIAQGRPLEGAAYIDTLQVIISDKFSSKNAEAIATAETKFNTAQKEAALADTRATLAETELSIRKRNNIIYGVAALALILALLGYLIYIQQRLKNKQQAQKHALQNALIKIETQNKLQEQRLRISRDLHDNIGSQLTFITSSLDNLNYGIDDKKVEIKSKIEKIGAFTKTTINELRDTIWAMNKEHISIEDLEARLGNLLQQIRAASPDLDVQFTIDSSIDKTLLLNSVEGINIYRIIQEAAANTVKYAKADYLKIALNRGQKLLNVSIIDNGTGFDTNKPTFGNGLRNIQKRAKDIGANCVIESTSNGTHLNIEL